jgi:PAS domain-containing protein
MVLTKKHPKDYERQYKESNDKFDIIFNLTSAASKILNADLTIIKVNQALIELLGFPAAEIEGTGSAGTTFRRHSGKKSFRSLNLKPASQKKINHWFG